MLTWESYLAVLEAEAVHDGEVSIEELVVGNVIRLADRRSEGTGDEPA